MTQFMNHIHNWARTLMGSYHFPRLTLREKYKPPELEAFCDEPDEATTLYQSLLGEHIIVAPPYEATRFDLILVESSNPNPINTDRVPIATRMFRVSPRVIIPDLPALAELQVLNVRPPTLHNPPRGTIGYNSDLIPPRVVSDPEQHPLRSSLPITVRSSSLPVAVSTITGSNPQPRGPVRPEKSAPILSVPVAPQLTSKQPRAVSATQPIHRSSTSSIRESTSTHKSNPNITIPISSKNRVSQSVLRMIDLDDQTEALQRLTARHSQGLELQSSEARTAAQNTSSLPRATNLSRGSRSKTNPSSDHQNAGNKSTSSHESRSAAPGGHRTRRYDFGVEYWRGPSLNTPKRMQFVGIRSSSLRVYAARNETVIPPPLPNSHNAASSSFSSASAASSANSEDILVVGRARPAANTTHPTFGEPRPTLRRSPRMYDGLRITESDEDMHLDETFLDDHHDFESRISTDDEGSELDQQPLPLPTPLRATERAQEQPQVSAPVPVIAPISASLQVPAPVRSANTGSLSQRRRESSQSEYNFLGWRYNSSGVRVNRQDQHVNRLGRRINLQGQRINDDGHPINLLGELIDEDGNSIDREGNRVNSVGQRVDSQGNRVNDQGHRINNLGERVNNEGHRVDDQGHRINNRGQRLDRKGRRLDAYGHRVNSRGERVNRYGSKIDSSVLAEQRMETIHRLLISIPSTKPGTNECFCFHRYSGYHHEAVKLPKCGHVFGRKCIHEWLLSKGTCPTCRDKIPIPK